MSEGEPVLVAVDFTADEVHLALADPDRDPLLLESYPLPSLDGEEAWAWEVGGRISTVFARDGAKRSALAIAVACPGAVDPVAGRLLRSTARPEWDGLSVVDALRRHIDAPIVAMNRTQAALRGEAERGAAAARGATDAVYVSLHGTPDAAVMTSSRIVSGAHSNAGALPDLPVLTADVPLEDDVFEHIVTRLADLAAFLDPALVILDGVEGHVTQLLPALQELIDQVAPGPQAVPAALGRSGAIVGALRAASIVAFEGQRRA